MEKKETVVEEVMNEAWTPFVELKKVIDKYPNVFTIQYKDGEGYSMNLNLDYLEPLLENQALNQ